MSVADRSRLRLPAIAAGAALAGSLATVLALGGAEARLAPEVAPTAAPATAAVDGCGPACSSHVVAGQGPGGQVLVIPGVSAFGMAIDAGAARIGEPVAVPAQPIAARAEIGFGTTLGATASVATEVAGAPAEERYTGGYAFASLVP